MDPLRDERRTHGRRRRSLAAVLLGGVLGAPLSACGCAGPPAEPVPAPPLDPGEVSRPPGGATDRAGEAAASPAAPPIDEWWSLQGADQAAAALSVGAASDAARLAAELLGREDEAALAGSSVIGLPALGDARAESAISSSGAAGPMPEGLRLRLIAGRAARLSGEPSNAVTRLEQASAWPGVGHHVPLELLQWELAQARYDLARSTSDEALARAQLERAAVEIERAALGKPARERAAMRVMYARIKGAMKGTDEAEDRRLARAALTAYGRVIRDYPFQPNIDRLHLERGALLVRAGKLREAAEELRLVAKDYPGTQAADEALDTLRALSSERANLARPTFSLDEQLERAQLARTLRNLPQSRAILDALDADEGTPLWARAQVLVSLAWTAYKQHDYGACVAAYERVRARVPSYDYRVEQARCLERAGRHADAVDLLMEVGGDAKVKKGLRGAAIWAALEHAVRGGLYERALELLDLYESAWTGHGQDRTWLRAMMLHLVGDDDAALVAMQRLAERSGPHQTTARYLAGKIGVTRTDPEERTKGAEQLRRFVAADPWSYYGLWARQRLVEAGEAVDELASLTPAAAAEVRPSWTAGQAALDDLAREFGAVEQALTRAAQLHRVGWIEQARREARAATDAYLNTKSRVSGGQDAGSTRSESLEVGISWRLNWSQPKPSLGAGGRALITSAQSHERLRSLLYLASVHLDDGHHQARLAAGADAPSYRARWHPRPYRRAIEREAQARGVDAHELWALMYTESRFRRHVVSPVGARGALQIMPFTARQLLVRLGEPAADFDPDRLYDIEDNARLATFYFAELLHKFDGQSPLAYASYNGGPDNVGRWVLAATAGGRTIALDDFIELIPFVESQRYTKRVMEVRAAYDRMYRGIEPRWPTEVRPVVRDNIDF